MPFYRLLGKLQTSSFGYSLFLMNNIQGELSDYYQILIGLLVVARLGLSKEQLVQRFPKITSGSLKFLKF